MKKIIKYTLGFLALFAISCYEGIDPITEVAPGVDETAPIVKIISPTEGTTIKVFEDVTSFDVKIEVTDDIELSTISILLDDSEIKSYNNFIDYRRALEEFTYSNLMDGDHVLKVVATDIEGKSTSGVVNFSKEPPYSPLFDGEVLYMPFDGDYRDLISFYIADDVGSPGFAGEGYAGSNSYRGTLDSYLTLPSEGLQSNEFSAAFWYKVSGEPANNTANDKYRAGILVAGDDATDRKQGFRLFREGNTTEQTIKLNVGIGTDESWNNGGVINVTDDWVHVAFTISQTESKIYFNGIEINSANLSAPIDWTGVGPLTIGAGGDTFSYWNHLSDNSAFDEFRIFNKALSQAEIQIMINSFNPYVPQYPGESFYMPFDGNFINLVGNNAAVEVGSPTVTDESYVGSGAYLGASESYLTFPLNNLFNNEFSGAFWYNVNAVPDRGGILTVAPPMNGTDNDLSSGFRLFREADGSNQRIKLHVGAGTDVNVWNDGFLINPSDGDWVHIAFTVSATETKFYVNGVLSTEKPFGNMTGKTISWANCTNLSIGSGAPGFIGWGHLSDNSTMDELRLFNKALTAEEVGTIFGGDYIPPYHGSTLYMPLDGTNVNKVTNTTATVVGTPGFAGESVVGSDAYAGATDSYLTFPITNLFNNEFSGAFWYNVNAVPDRAGILTVAPPMNGADNDLSSGFRLFREADGSNQRIKLHVGAGTDVNVWNDGFLINPSDGDWVHIAFTVSATETKFYVNGVLSTEKPFGNMTDKTISWANCTNLSIGSGAPGFIGWGHLSDLSYIDDLYIFDRTLTEEEIQALMAP